MCAGYIDEGVMEMAKATIDNDSGFTVFKTGDATLRFRAPYSLERYVRIKEWDNGYLVVDAKYEHSAESEEEYIDLIPILKDLYIDPEKFLSSVKSVEVAHVRS